MTAAKPNRVSGMLCDWLALVCYRVARTRQREMERWLRWSDYWAALAAPTEG